MQQAIVSILLAITLQCVACQDIPPIPFDEENPDDSSCDTRGWNTWHIDDIAVQYQPFYMTGAVPTEGKLDLYRDSPAAMFFTTNYTATSWVGTGFAGEVYIYDGQPDLEFYFAYWGWHEFLDIISTMFEERNAAMATSGSADDITEYLWVEYGGSLIVGFYTTLYIDSDYDPDGEGNLPAAYQLRADYAAFRCSFTLDDDD